MKMKLIAAMAAGLFVAGLSTGANAKVLTKSFDYKQADVTLDGFIAWDDALKGKRASVLVFPTYTGPSEFEQDVARKLAKLGYVVMVADIYGKGIRPKAGKEAGAEMAKYMGERTMLRARAKAGLDRLLEEKNVAASMVATIGYCFGGAAALELGRQGANVKDIVSLHGTLANPTPADAKNIKGHVLVLHGADDPVTPPKQIEEFKEEMKSAGVDLTYVSYSQTRHSFAMPSAGSDNTKNSAYNERSAKRAWVAMVDFLHETLSK
jgi:dienelactone hydrolase